LLLVLQALHKRWKYDQKDKEHRVSSALALLSSTTSSTLNVLYIKFFRCDVRMKKKEAKTATFEAKQPLASKFRFCLPLYNIPTFLNRFQRGVVFRMFLWAGGQTPWSQKNVGPYYTAGSDIVQISARKTVTLSVCATRKGPHFTNSIHSWPVPIRFLIRGRVDAPLERWWL
jgi:hypothetical protein